MMHLWRAQRRTRTPWNATSTMTMTKARTLPKEKCREIVNEKAQFVLIVFCTVKLAPNLHVLKQEDISNAFEQEGFPCAQCESAEMFIAF